jgi:hypothetical protein
LAYLKTTKAGYALWKELDLSPRLYTVSDTEGASLTLYSNARINVSKNPPINNLCGYEKAPLAPVLAHEMGHLARQDGPAYEPVLSEHEWANIIQYEDPIRAEWGIPPRTELRPPANASRDCGCQ